MVTLADWEDAVLDTVVSEPAPRKRDGWQLAGRGGIRIDWSDDELWRQTKGRRFHQPRNRDPLTQRITALRLAEPQEIRRQLDLLLYGPSARRIERLARKAVRTQEQQAAVDAHQAEVERLRALWRELKPAR